MKKYLLNTKQRVCAFMSIFISASLIICLLVAGCAGKMITSPEMSLEPAVSLLLTPKETITSGEAIVLNVIGYDAMGRLTSKVGTVEWSLTGLSGSVIDGTYTPDTSVGAHAGTVIVQSGEITASARVRVIPPLPWTEDFENIELEKAPSHWISATGKYFVREKDGKKVLVKTPVQRGLDKSNVYIGAPTMKDYQIQVDLMGTRDKRRMPDMGLIANRYTLDLQGRQQRLQIRSWASDLRMAKTIDFSWEADVWYTMKMKVETTEDKAIIMGKVWRKGENEPPEWTITTEDPLPNREGSPGIYAYSVTEIYYDNLKVW